MPEYARICVNMLNMPNSAWMVFASHFPNLISSLLERVLTYSNVDTKLEKIIIWRNIRLFSWRDKIVPRSTWFVFCFILYIFTSKISSLLLPLGAERLGAVNLDITAISHLHDFKQSLIYRCGLFIIPK